MFKGTIIDYYIGAYGPTIRIEMHSLDQILQFQKTVRDIMKNDVDLIKLGNLSGITIDGIDDLILVGKPNGVRVKRIVNVIKSKTKKPTVEWTHTTVGWIHVYGLIDGLVKNPEPSHQYLTKEEDGILIELVYVKK